MWRRRRLSGRQDDGSRGRDTGQVGGPGNTFLKRLKVRMRCRKQATSADTSSFKRLNQVFRRMCRCRGHAWARALAAHRTEVRIPSLTKPLETQMTMIPPFQITACLASALVVAATLVAC